MVTQGIDGMGQLAENEPSLRLFPPELLLELRGEARLPERSQALIGLCRKFRVHAAFLGFPAITRLARKIDETLSRLRSDAGIEPEHWTLIDSAIETLQQAVNLPHLSTLTSQIDSLCDALDSSSVGLNRSATANSGMQIVPFNDSAAVALVKPGTDRTERVADIEHQDLDIYHREVLDGMEKCSEEESWLVSQVASAAEELAGRQSDQRPAKKLLSILEGHRFFHDVDRACIVGLVPGGNQLVVVDSAIHQRLRDRGATNHMPPGYSCFISPTGSLTTLKPGTLRIFDDSSKVLNSFVRAGKPAQRSIAYIAESGLKSGICLAIGRGETVQGYMFLNSLKPSFFNHVMRDYAPLLSLFALIGTLSLDAAGFTLAASRGIEEVPTSIPRQSSLFKSAEFAEYVAQCLITRTGQVSEIRVVVPDDLHFIYAPAVLAPTVAKLAMGLGISQIGRGGDFTINVRNTGDKVQFELVTDAKHLSANTDWVEPLLKELNSQLVGQPVTVARQTESIAVQTPFEPVLNPQASTLYSIAY